MKLSAKITLGAGALALALIVAGGYRATHHPIYKCHTDKAGETVCDLIKWEGNK